MNKFSHALKTIELKSSSDGLLVVLPEDDGQPAQEPFSFPHLPWSTMNWLFLRVQGELTLRNPDEIVFNDVDARINEVIRVLGLSS